MKQTSFALITAAGSSSRMGGNKKEFIHFNQKPLILYTIAAFDKSDIIDSIYITYTPGKKKEFNDIIASEVFCKPVIPVEGGKTRQQSVYNGLLAMRNAKPEYVLIHDGARPAVTETVIEDVYNSVILNNACAPVTHLIDSIKIIDSSGIITGHPDRNSYRAIQTPQGFDFKKILKAHIIASDDNRGYTDDTEIYSRYIGTVSTVDGDENNRKITYKNDLDFFKAKLGGGSMLRIGQGYDIHRLEKGNSIFLGGVAVPAEKKATAHSDGDVLIHAVIDSLLGAVAEKDIGAHFPPSDPAYKNISSRILLKKVVSIIKSKGFYISNLDSTIILETPKLRNYIGSIRKSLSEDLETDIELISVKAKTKEQCDAAGRGEAIEAFSTVLLQSAGV